MAGKRQFYVGRKRWVIRDGVRCRPLRPIAQLQAAAPSSVRPTLFRTRSWSARSRSALVVQGKALAERKRVNKLKRVAKWRQDEEDALWSLLADPWLDDLEEEEEVVELCPVCLESEPLLVLRCPGNHGLHRLCFGCLQRMHDMIVADPWGAGIPAVGLTNDNRRVPIFALRCPFRCGVFCSAYCPLGNMFVGFAVVMDGW